MSTGSKSIIVPVINDLCTDQRVLRLCAWWHARGYAVTLYGRLLPGSLPMNDLPYRIVRKKHFFNTGMLFYAEYSIRLSIFLLQNKSAWIWSNDLDTLPASALAKRLSPGRKLVYDSHELFTEVPELQHNAFARNVWLFFEQWCIPAVDHAFTVNKSIADIYTKKYGKPFRILRNMPYRLKQKPAATRADLGLPAEKKIILLQGSGINVQRGAEEAVEAMKYLQTDALLLIIGSGDVIPQLKSYVTKNELQDKVWFLPRKPFSELLKYTVNADIGLSLDKDTNLNYRYSLPNKIFDYIQAGIPVLVSDLPELRRIVTEYNVGEVLQEHSSRQLAAQLDTMLASPGRLNEWRTNAESAARILCREEEEKVLESLPL
ncbi:MAG: glycosyltransferase [Bacteroidia bacterium]|nr:glycosyltransferase [Bacteroidia bacterium]